MKVPATKVTTSDFTETAGNVYRETCKNLRSDNTDMVHPDIQFGKNVQVGFNAVIDRDVQIGKNCVVGHNSVIDRNVKIGDNVRLGNGVVIEPYCSIGKGTFIGHHTVMRPKLIMGENCTIGHLTVFEGDSVIGNRVLIHAQCHITKDVLIEDDVFIAPFFCGANTKKIKHGRNYDLRIEGYTIRRAVRIGIGVLLLPGIEIGQNAQIGAGSVVTKDVPPREVWFGNPARKFRDVPGDELL